MHALVVCRVLRARGAGWGRLRDRARTPHPARGFAARHPPRSASLRGEGRRLLSALLRDMVPRSAPAASTQGRSFMIDRFFLLLSAFAAARGREDGECRKEEKK